MKNFLEEFKAFAMRGNVVDLAVAVVIGLAFGKIIASLVEDIIMPLVGAITGGVDFSGLVWNVTGEAAVNYGLFINATVTFLIIALAIFSVVKMISKMQKQKEEAPAEPPKPTKEEVLLTEIRDLLKK